LRCQKKSKKNLSRTTLSYTLLCKTVISTTETLLSNKLTLKTADVGIQLKKNPGHTLKKARRMCLRIRKELVVEMELGQTLGK
jgi:hypothetical protein